MLKKIEIIRSICEETGIRRNMEDDSRFTKLELSQLHTFLVTMKKQIAGRKTDG